MNSNDSLVGCELSGDRIRIAAIKAARSNSRSPGTRRFRCEEIVIPNVEAYAPAGLPPTSDLVSPLKATLGRLGISGGRAAVALSGSRMVLRYFVGSGEQVRAELQQATERSISYVQFGLGDRVVGEHFHRMTDGRDHALLGISPAATINPLAKALEQVGLRVAVIEPALVALTRMASITGQLDSKVGFVVLVDGDGINIGVVLDGHVLFSRRPSPAGDVGSETPGPQSAGSDRPSSLPRELEKMSRHYVRVFGASEEVRRIIVCGPENLVRPQTSALEDSQDFQADLLRIDDAVSTALAIPLDDLAGKEAHVVALGAAAGLVGECSQVVGPNLTSEPKVRRRPALEALFRAALLPTVAAVGVWGMAYLAEAHLDTTVARLRIEADHPLPVETKYQELQRQLIQTEQRAAHLGELVQKLQDRNWRGLLDTIRICVPDRLWLTRVQLKTEDQLAIQGTAHDESLIYQFREDLEGSPLFESATIISTTSSRRDNTIVAEFSVECMISTGLLKPDASNP